MGQIYYTDSMLAPEFISKHDGRFLRMKVAVENGAITRPATLVDAFQRASRYKGRLEGFFDIYGSQSEENNTTHGIQPENESTTTSRMDAEIMPTENPR